MSSQAKAFRLQAETPSIAASSQLEVTPVMISVEVLSPGVALVAGLLVLLFPRLLHIIVGIYLLGIGILGLWPHFMH